MLLWRIALAIPLKTDSITFKNWAPDGNGMRSTFRRDGADLHCQVPISRSTAELGGQVEIHAINGGEIKLSVPKGTQTGQRYRLVGKGMPVLRSKKVGDMYVQVAVQMPTK